jgi:hypothetical protein
MNQIEFKLCDGRKEFRFQYEIEGKTKNYYPDFYLPVTDEFIEVKPIGLVFGKLVQLKAKYVKEVYNRNYRFITDKDIDKITSSNLHQLIESGIVKIDANKVARLK